MKKTRFSEEQMVGIVREADERPVAEVAKKHGSHQPRRGCRSPMTDWSEESRQVNLAQMQARELPALVSIGIHAGTVYSDCTVEFVQRMQAVYDIYAAGALRVDAPFISWTKADIWRSLLDEGCPARCPGTSCSA